MKNRYVDENIVLKLTVCDFTEELYRLTDRNRTFLKQWLPWLDSVQTSRGTEYFIQTQQVLYQKGEALHVSIFYKGKLAGVVGFNAIDEKGTGHIGYWLAQEYTGFGIMTRSVRSLISYGFKELGLAEVDIRCALDNTKSRAVAERLGFVETKTIKNAEDLYGKWVDHVVYVLKRS